jgi:hypothetical protein
VVHVLIFTYTVKKDQRFSRPQPDGHGNGKFVYVTDGNIMYLTDASRFLISCVIQHYAPVVGWGGGVDEQMHNVDYDPGP